MNKLIYEIDSDQDVLIEESTSENGKTSKTYKIAGIFSTIGEKNRNGRIYGKHLWESEVRKYQMNLSEGNINTLMEWEHPARSNVDPMEAIAKITKLHIDGKYVMGEAVLLDNPKANQLKSLIENGVKISVSSRGLGTVKNGIVEKFDLITYDIVSTPSDFNATMNGMVESYQLNEGILEGLSFDDDGEIITESTEEIQPTEREILIQKVQEISGREIKEGHNVILGFPCELVESSNLEFDAATTADATQLSEALSELFVVKHVGAITVVVERCKTPEELEESDEEKDSVEDEEETEEELTEEQVIQGLNQYFDSFLNQLKYK